jgi:hypothetical protein
MGRDRGEIQKGRQREIEGNCTLYIHTHILKMGALTFSDTLKEQ